MTETLTTRLQKVVALRDAAAPGPWEARGTVVDGPNGTILRVGGGLDLVVERYETHQRENATFIAAAPSIVQLAVELGAECERLRVALRNLLNDGENAMDFFGQIGKDQDGYEAWNAAKIEAEKALNLPYEKPNE